jgi:hypothetical protein
MNKRQGHVQLMMTLYEISVILGTLKSGLIFPQNPLVPLFSPITKQDGGVMLCHLAWAGVHTYIIYKTNLQIHMTIIQIHMKSIM